MARRVVILVLVLLAILGVVLGDAPKASPGASASATPAADSPDSIGPVDDPAGAEGAADVVEGPVGGPTPLGEYAAAATSPTGSSGATALHTSAAVGGAAAALAGLFA
uniref:Anther-specific protein BCP1 n=1 Tax=Kalanchoe fedtschenkoi TaxID=63787 RepID=A0A7N0TF53_KALFE